MSNITKQDIIEAIRRTAKENSGKPLGAARFERETGITPYDWQRFWARFGDAQKEAGFEPNQLQSAYAKEFLIEKLIRLIRKFGKFPTYREINVERSNDPELPTKSVFQRLGTKKKLATKVMEYCAGKTGYDDIIELCRSDFQKPSEEEKSDDSDVNVGEVYLFKSGRYYKIGRTSDTVRRGREIRIQLPERTTLVHSIKTDDPSGIEAYWHKRFEAKRMQGEWFNLSSADVRAFKCWRRIV